MPPPIFNHLGLLDQQLDNHLRGINRSNLLLPAGMRTRELDADENEQMNQLFDRAREPDTPGMMPSAPSEGSYEIYDPDSGATIFTQYPPTDSLLRNPLPGGGFAEEGVESGRRMDPFIYGGRKPSNTNEYLTDQGIANEIRKRDIVINKPTQLPATGEFAGDPGRVRSQFWLRDIGKDTRLAEQAFEWLKNRNRGQPYALPDMDLSGTDFAATPEDIKRRHEEQRSIWDRLFGNISTRDLEPSPPEAPSRQIFPAEEGEFESKREAVIRNTVPWAKDLPEPVLRSIFGYPSYGEGDKIPVPTWGSVDSFWRDRNLNSLNRLGIMPGREAPLVNELDFVDNFKDWQYPLREDQRRGPLESPYGRPEGYPFALY